MYKQIIQKISGSKAPSKTSSTPPLQKVDPSSVSISLTNPELQEQLNMIGLTIEDLALLKAIKPLIQEHIDFISASFYQSVLNVEQLKEVITKYTTIERLQKTLNVHLIEMFDGKIDEAFVGKRLRIAQVHQRIGLEPKWYMGAFQNLQNGFMDVIRNNITDPELVNSYIRAATKLLNFEQQLVLEAYEKENMKQREQEYEQIKNELKSQILYISTELAALTEQTNASVQELIANSLEVNSNVKQTAEKSRDSQRLSETGQSTIQELGTQIQSIRHSTHSMRSTIERLSESTMQIRSITRIVQDIADQTKLLSLNASIEAARAGEQGRGFSVVASEVSKLSEQTKDTVSQIAEIIQTSTALTMEVVRSIEEVQAKVEAGQQEADHTSSVFEQIIHTMDHNIINISKVEKEMNGLVRIIEEIGSATEKVSASAEVLNQTTHSL